MRAGLSTRRATRRYVRLYSDGNTTSDMNHYIEVEVYGLPKQSLLAAVGAVGAALALRLAAPETMPVHTDEADNASILGDMLEGKPYRYDPVHRHGPTLYFATYPWVCACGARALRDPRSGSCGPSQPSLARRFLRPSSCFGRASRLRPFSPRPSGSGPERRFPYRHPPRKDSLPHPRQFPGD